MRAVVAAICLLISGSMLLWCVCSPTTITGGTSTSENGRIAGTIVDGRGVPSANTQVMLFPADFDPVRNNGTVQTDTTDTSGNYIFTDVYQGNYTIQSIELSARTRVLRNDVTVNDDTVMLPDDTLQKPGSIRIALPDSITTASGYLYIPGTSISVPLEGAGTFVLFDSVPAGTIPAIIYMPVDTFHPSILREDITVEAEDTMTIVTTGWKFSRMLRLNTTATGAGTTQEVYRFPVLVRLTTVNFDFAGAMRDGSDLLFTKPDGTMLPHQIERWDSAGSGAEVWVLVDTVRGNDSTTNFIMYWGNPGAGNGTNAGTVFDTANGFSAVWHMTGNTDTLHDATANRCDGIRFGKVAASSGAIGYGQRFDTAAAYFDMGNVLDSNGGNLTVSAWIKRSQCSLQTIMAKSDGGTPHSSYGWNFTITSNGQLHFFAATEGPSWGSEGAFDFWSGEEMTITDTTGWHHIAAVFDRSGATQCRLYIDGSDVTGNTNGDIDKVGTLTTPVSLRIGAEADDQFQWIGSLDECIISHTARAESWIRLCYANQSSTDLLVRFE